MKTLPQSLRLQLAIAFNQKLFTRVPLFKAAEPECIVAFAERLTPLIALPGEYLIKEGEVGTALYLIGRGKVAILKLIPDYDDLSRGGGGGKMKVPTTFASAFPESAGGGLRRSRASRLSCRPRFAASSVSAAFSRLRSCASRAPLRSLTSLRANMPRIAVCSSVAPLRISS